jgi:hypothetical protein
MKRRCPKCAAEWELKGAIGFREECPECAAFLHTCPNCRNFEPNRRDCRIPTTDPVHDREGMNFCEEFEFGTPTTGPSIASATLPGNGKAPSTFPSAPKGKMTADEARRKFENLFRDPKA